MDSALAEFSGQGYGASSVNNICSAQGISKGIIYHYFKTKDDLFLACVKECFSLLTAYLSKRMQQGEGTPPIPYTRDSSAKPSFRRRST